MNINYVKEREAFYEWLTFNTLSPTAQSLWNALFTICNAKGWPDGYIKVPEIMLRSYMHVSSDALLDARNQLKNKFIKGDRRAAAAAYKLNFFTDEAEVCTEKTGKPADKPADKVEGKPADKQANKEAAKPADTNKLNVNQNQNVNVNQTKGGRIAGAWARANDSGSGFCDLNSPLEAIPGFLSEAEVASL